jgi:cytochrome c-type biogenesis protein CcmH/NrfG
MPPGATSPSPANDPTLKPIKPAGAGAGASASPSGNREQTAADHMAIGDSAASQGRWADAAKAYQNAANLDPKSASIHEKLGEAQYKAGSKEAAQATLQQALKLGAKEAAKYLGHIAREQGDNAGATGYYQQYLKGSPPDKADIERIIHEMSGG